MEEKNLKSVSFQLERQEEAKAFFPLQLARIVNQQKDIYTLDLNGDVMNAKVSGKMMYRAMNIMDYPSVGDYVMVGNDSDTKIIHHILKRKSILERKSAGITTTAQVIATNIDYILICMSLNENFNLRRLERYLSISWVSGAIPIIVLTKFDLYEKNSKKLEMVYSVSSGALVIITSEKIEPFYNDLLSVIHPGKTYALIGSSGVGKSTIINHLMNKIVTATREIGLNDKGRHVTTSRSLFESSDHAYIIDTPGMRELQVDDADLNSTFSDIEELSKSCKFNNCAHNHEPGCRVREAIQEGFVSEERLKNYKSLLREFEYQQKRLQQKERKIMKASKMNY